MKHRSDTRETSPQPQDSFAASRPPPTAAASIHPIHQWQHQLGNRALGGVLQAKLKISQPQDAHEQEADRVAEQVVRMTGSTRAQVGNDLSHAPDRVQRACGKCEDTDNELQRKTTSAECATRYYETTGEIDVVGLLADLRVPTLVMHARADAQVPFEYGHQLAAGIPGAKFVALQTNNHIVLEQDPATDRFFEEVSLFLAK